MLLRRGNETSLTLQDGELAPLVKKKGDVVKWTVPSTLRFLGQHPPCALIKQGGQYVCKINIDVPSGTLAQFHYGCTGCPDPEVDVGSSVQFPPPAQVAALASPSHRVVIECRGSAVAVDPAEVPDKDIQDPVTTGSVIKWFAVYGGGVANWTLKFEPNNPCRETMPLTPGSTCTVKEGTTPGSYTYTVKVDSGDGGCNGQVGTGKINVSSR